jgi:hypothetical protein
VFIGAPLTAETATYQFIVDNTWSEITHPDAYPGIIDPHFSHIGGSSHNDQITFWEPNTLSSPGIIRMQEWGAIDFLTDEIEDAIAAGTAYNLYSFKIWFPAPSETYLTIEVSDTHPLVTLVTMLGPSPDWFVGVSNLPLWENGEWVDEVVIPLFPYDGGTRENIIFQLFGPETIPQEPIQLITTPPLGSRQMGSFTLRRTCSDGDIAFPYGVENSDVAYLAQHWLESNCGNNNDCEGADVDQSDSVAIGDLLLLANNWLNCRSAN